MKNTKIQWATHTFSPWWGCSKVSEGCSHCYAEALSKRTGRAAWGAGRQRWRTSPTNWNQPLLWDRQKSDSPQRVFVASMADIFDDEVPIAWREDFWNLTRQCENLRWLLLTKRPENIASMLPDWWSGTDKRFWLGISVENQARAEERIPILQGIPSAVRFLSAEPLLGPLQLSLEGIHQVIAGGESGPNFRPMHRDWVRSIRDQCNAASVPFFFKQWSGFRPKELGRELDGREWSEVPME